MESDNPIDFATASLGIFEHTRYLKNLPLIQNWAASLIVLPDVLAPDLDIVFCGTAVGHESARREAYYAGQGNSFWQTLFDVGLTPCKLSPEEYPKLLQFRLGLTDLAKTVAGNDRGIASSDFDVDGLRRKICEFHPRLIAFTGKRAAKVFLGRKNVDYGLLQDRVCNTCLFVLPSPSGAARHYWDVGPWEELAGLCSGESRDSRPNGHSTGCAISDGFQQT